MPIQKFVDKHVKFDDFSRTLAEKLWLAYKRSGGSLTSQRDFYTAFDAVAQQNGGFRSRTYYYGVELVNQIKLIETVREFRDDEAKKFADSHLVFNQDAKVLAADVYSAYRLSGGRLKAPSFYQALDRVTRGRGYIMADSYCYGIELVHTPST